VIAAAVNKKYFFSARVCFGADSCVSSTGSNASELDFSNLEDWYMAPAWQYLTQKGFKIFSTVESLMNNNVRSIPNGMDKRHLIGKWLSQLGLRLGNQEWTPATPQFPTTFGSLPGISYMRPRANDAR
jgi:hypothetical protein